MVQQHCAHCGKSYTLSSTQIRVGSRFCSKPCHYAKRREEPKRSIEDRFWEKVFRGGEFECWPWMAGKFADGYGALSVDGRPQRASRLSYEFAHGALPEGSHVLHQCDNKACVNPLHLRVGTHQENMEEMARRGRAARNFKLSDDEVQLVRDADGSLKEIASRFSVSVGLVGLIRGKAGYRVRRPVAMSKRKEKKVSSSIKG